jgi:ferric-dicitrate binding protein FerR (iron transport regulator)
MSERDEDDIQVLISEQAAGWFVQLKDGELSETEQRRYLCWLKQSPAHVAEVFRIEQIHRLLRDSLRIRREKCS